MKNVGSNKINNIYNQKRKRFIVNSSIVIYLKSTF